MSPAHYGTLLLYLPCLPFRIGRLRTKSLFKKLAAPSPGQVSLSSVDREDSLGLAPQPAWSWEDATSPRHVAQVGKVRTREGTGPTGPLCGLERPRRTSGCSPWGVRGVPPRRYLKGRVGCRKEGLKEPCFSGCLRQKMGGHSGSTSKSYQSQAGWRYRVPGPSELASHTGEAL